MYLFVAPRLAPQIRDVTEKEEVMPHAGSATLLAGVPHSIGPDDPQSGYLRGSHGAGMGAVMERVRRGASGDLSGHQ